MNHAAAHRTEKQQKFIKKQKQGTYTPKRISVQGNINLPKLGQRSDIQGMRALAIITVVLYHAGIKYISGGFIGVDFFFVLSGFLITYLLLSEIQLTGGISFKKFWGRRARRLIPASTVIIFATILAAGKLAPFTDKRPIGIDSIYALFFSANWRFAQQQTDYLANDRVRSPFLHFWSLGVEEQFYFVWPVLLGLFAFLFLRRNIRVSLTVVFTLLLVSSLALSVYLTNANQPYAFFGTPSRAWQLIAGALTALWLSKIVEINAKIKLLFSIAGLSLLFGAAFFLRESGTLLGAYYPSWLAIIPTLAAVLLIAGGTGTNHFISKILSLRPLTWIGDISYSLYLWHWPLLVLGEMKYGKSLEVRMSLVAISVALAFLTYSLIENPVRKWKSLSLRPVGSILVAAVILAATTVPAHALSTYQVSSKVSLDNTKVVVKKPPAVKIKKVKTYFASTVPLTSLLDDSDGVLQPSVNKVTDDIPAFHTQCQRTTDDKSPFVLPKLEDCSFGAAEYDHTVFVTGDSISTAITPGIIEYATNNKWRVILMSNAQCSFTTHMTEIDGKPYTTCHGYKKVIFDKIKELKPDVVVVANSPGSNSSVISDDGKTLRGEQAYAAAADGMNSKILELQSLGIKVALVSPPSRAPKDLEPANCLATKQDAKACHFPILNSFNFMKSIYETNSKVLYVDAASTYCAEDCFPVIRNYIVYRDGVHWSNTYSKHILSPLFGDLLKTVLEKPESSKSKSSKSKSKEK